jgi:hypothetical protein
MSALFAPPRSKPASARPARLERVVLLGAGRASTSAFVGTEALISEIDPARRWDVACRIADLFDGLEVRRLPRIDLDRASGVRAARDRLRAVYLELGASSRRVDALLASQSARPSAR